MFYFLAKFKLSTYVFCLFMIQHQQRSLVESYVTYDDLNFTIGFHVASIDQLNAEIRGEIKSSKVNWKKFDLSFEDSIILNKPIDLDRYVSFKRLDVSV